MVSLLPLLLLLPPSLLPPSAGVEGAVEKTPDLESLRSLASRKPEASVLVSSELGKGGEASGEGRWDEAR